MPTSNQIPHRWYKTSHELYDSLILRGVPRAKRDIALARVKLGIPWLFADDRIERYHSPYRLDYHLKGKKGTCYGIELEVELDEDNGEVCDDDAAFIHAAAARTIGTGIIRTECDGSLRNGIEIIFAPLTEGEIRFLYVKLYQFLQELRKHGFTSHDSGRCGLHVHISKPPADTLKKMEHLMFDSPEVKAFWKDLSRRSNYQYSEMKRQAINSHCKYFALNKMPKNTIEFRLFRGTLKPASFFAALESVFAMVNHTEPKSDRKRHSWRSFVSMIRSNNKYHFLQRYVRENMHNDWKVKPYRKRNPAAKAAYLSQVELEKQRKRDERERRRFNTEQNERHQYLLDLQRHANRQQQLTVHNVGSYHADLLSDVARVAPLRFGHRRVIDRHYENVMTPIFFVTDRGSRRLNDGVTPTIVYSAGRGRRPHHTYVRVEPTALNTL